MNNLPDNFEDLLQLLRQFVEESTDRTLNTFDAKTIGEKIEALVEQYEAKDDEEPTT